MTETQQGQAQHDADRQHRIARRPDPLPARSWTLLTHHARLLLAVAERPDARVQDLASVVGVTPRAALTLLRDLEDANLLHRVRVGRRNRYTIHPDARVGSEVCDVRTVRQFLAAFSSEET
ncbi:winged helix-turn-helix domain-containing protein [Blastococcus sp. PRF04-17]|uniref:winged helix-turn-helix domain-containing protein n=1 Tax=Blastococcus sp. PRF04-17 TaxID=2933797 RepID=UPI001FF63854|nr:winged helix-turn-helix domain-containing protein [Blastococcus sp. PRF04-17]UOX99941.1 winged helix-turn-helix domain-containing protein [Blastococcus sp. PRF04-17]